MKYSMINIMNVFILLCVIAEANSETKYYTVNENEIGHIAMADSCTHDQQKLIIDDKVQKQANGRVWDVLVDYSIANSTGFQSAILKGEIRCGGEGGTPERIVESIILTVRNTNRQPYISDTSKNVKLRLNNAGAFEAGSKRIATFDPDGDSVTISPKERLPSGFSFDAASGVLSWRLLNRDESDAINSNGKILFSLGDNNGTVADSLFVARDGSSLPILIKRYVGDGAVHGNRLIAANKNILRYRVFNPNNPNLVNVSAEVHLIEPAALGAIINSNFDPKTHLLSIDLGKGNLDIASLKPGDARGFSFNIQVYDGGQSGNLKEEFVMLGSASAERNAENVKTTLKRVAALETEVFKKRKEIEKTQGYMKWVPIIFDAFGGVGGITAWAEGATLTGGIAGFAGIGLIVGTKIYSFVKIDQMNANDSALIAIGRYSENILAKSKTLSASVICNSVDTLGACESDIKDINREVEAVCPKLGLENFNCNDIPLDATDDNLKRIFGWVPRSN